MTFGKPQRTLRFYSLKFQRLKGDPAFLARGVAIGMFIGITPTIPLHTIGILLLALILRGSIVAGLLTSIVISNPLTMVPLYYLSYKIGTLLTPYQLSWERFGAIMQLIEHQAGFREILAAMGQLGQESLLVLLVGGFVLATPPAIAAYFASYKFFEALKKKREQRRRERPGAKQDF